jgi:hypothetical protein
MSRAKVNIENKGFAGVGSDVRPGGAGLDSEAEVYVLLVAGVRVKVVWGAAVELVALAEFASDEEAESYGSEAGGDPAYGLDEGGFLFGFILFVAREGKDAGGGDVLGCGVAGAGCGAKLHDIE